MDWNGMSRLGPFEEDTIVVGDCLDIMAQMPDGCVDLVIIDPPFSVQSWTSTLDTDHFATGINWASWARNWISEVYRLLPIGGPVFAVANYQGFHYLAYELARARFLHHSDFQVAYKGGRKRPSLTKFHVVTETWFYGTKGKAKQFKHGEVQPLTGKGSHLSYWLDPDGNTARRWEKSEALLSYFVSLATNEGDLIFDPFIGSGTTAVVADRLGRKFFGCDINPDYVEMALERLEKDREGRQLSLL